MGKAKLYKVLDTDGELEKRIEQWEACAAARASTPA
eukprot:gene5760-11583_t